ncbi:hypothetical protein GGR52DRAFT_574293 [Hypoxylon sp. FL1284]|nr:hypothetical protein GGR52DRAFT_574293 [Hypoxylon sp. FL1284]
MPIKDEFRALLDETTILSISSDYNLQDTQEFAAARQVLLTLSKDVEAEEATGFNPSGFVGHSVTTDLSALNLDDEADDGEVTSSDVKSASDRTPMTERSITPSLVSSGSTRTAPRDAPGLIHIGVFDGLSDEDKEQNLAQMFVELKPIDIKQALKKSKGDASLAMDELLSLQWLEHTGQRAKGIDGFFVDEDYVFGKKKKVKKKRKVPKVSSPKSPVVEDTNEGPDQNSIDQSDKIELIADRLNVPAVEVASIYNQRKASLGATIIEILDNYISLGLSEPDSRLLPDIKRETVEFSWIPPEYIKASFEICQLRDEALDIIRILADYFEKPAYLRYNVSYSVVASDPEAAASTIDLTAASDPKQTERSSASPRSPIIDAPRASLNHVTNLATASAASRAFAESRNHAAASAAAAFRKSRSDPLFRQAGSYYAERAREQAAGYRRASRVEADYLVDRQSTGGSMIDLHGVMVQDGVDIARDRVRRWWDGLGGEGEGERARRAKRDGFTVVTGIGRHSADGRSQLRINVFKALVADGWKVEVQTGSYLVVGRR